MSHWLDYAARARALMLPEPERSAFCELSAYADSAGSCPSCGADVGRHEADRCSHARRCKLLQADVQTADRD